MAEYGKDDWSRINNLLDAALDRAPDERASFLQDACDDPDLRSEVEALLDEMDAAESSGFMATPVGAHAEELAREALDLADEAFALDMQGQEIGPYRIERELGRGGMGAVYLAERADGEFDQQVALKLMRSDRVDRSDLIARLRRERQILASLQHEHIARLLDGGVDEDGRPYLAMEYVEGETIERYCDRKGLEVEERLKLFQQVGEAVAAAHRRAVIHRDLKPSNVLVRERAVGGDGASTRTEPFVKLLDFGIAKLLEPEDESAPRAPTLTQAGMMVMTPEYAAPEQVRGTDITTTTDVYQLGILLYELLTGTRPFEDGAGEKRGRARIRAIENAILSTEATRPSTAVTRLDPEAARTTRGADTATLTRRLRGDLDAICLKAMRKEPEARYRSVEAFMEDLRRYLDGRPVEARRGTVLYRTRKLARRRWKELATAAAFVVILVGGGIFYTAQVAQERDRARTEAQKAEQVSEFLVNLFDVSDPYSTQEIRGDTVSAGFLLKRSANRIREELASEPEVRSTMLDKIGQVYTNLGFFSEAEALLQEAVRERQETHGPQHPNVAESLENLSNVHYERGDYVKAEELSREALGIRRTAFDSKHPDVAESLNNVAVTMEPQGKYNEAEELYRKALIVLKDHYGPTHQQVASTLNNLGVLLEKKGQYPESEKLHREALTIQRKVLPPEHPSLANNLGNLGEVLREQGKYVEAESYVRQALTIFRSVYEEGHPEIAYRLNDLAIVLEKTGRLEEAEKLHRDALKIKIDQFGENAPSVATSLHNLAIVLGKRGQYAEAENLHRRVLEIDRKQMGNKHPWIATDLNDLALALAMQEKNDEAETLYRQALAMRRELLGRDHPHVGFTLSSLGNLLIRMERFEEAEHLLIESQDILNDHLDKQHAAWRATLQRFIMLYETWNKPEQATRWQARLEALETDAQEVARK
jgi:serine/threonine-protein kinase